MANINTYDKLCAACDDAASYPANVLRSRLFKHTLHSYNRRLNGQSEDLFDNDPEYPEHAGVSICEAYDGGGQSTIGSLSHC